MASGSPVPPGLRSSILYCKVVAYLLITISHPVYVLVQLLPAASAGVLSWFIKVSGRWRPDCYEHYIISNTSNTIRYL